MHQEVYFKDQIQELKSYIGSTKPENIFVVRGNKSFHASGADIFIDTLIGGSNYTSFFKFDPNPQLADLIKGIELFCKGKYELIIAIGGGSVIDMAKLISVFAHQKQEIISYVKEGEQIESKKTPLIAIPTTAGTGAEATHFAVLYIDKNKYSVAAQPILPNAVYLSSEFSKTADPYLTACTGLDAFCQAIESVWSVNANDESQEYALEAIQIIWNHLLKAVKDNDFEAKQKMLKAAFLAGKAINITKTTAPHALSYAFTSYYNIPHGHAVAISLPFFIQYNYNVTELDCTDPKGPLAVRKRINKILRTLDIKASNANLYLEYFFNSLNIFINIQTLIENFDENIIANNVNVERLSNNPRQVSKETIHNFLTKSNA